MKTPTTRDKVTIAAATGEDGCGYHPVYLRAKIRNGEIPATKVRGQWLLDRAVVDVLRAERVMLQGAGVTDVN